MPQQMDDVEMVSFFSTETDWKEEEEQLQNSMYAKYRLKMAFSSPRILAAAVGFVLVLFTSSLITANPRSRSAADGWKSTVFFKKLALPSATVRRIEDDPHSVQAKAYNWLKSTHEDTFELVLMKSSKLQQLFGLSAIYFAMNGDNWYTPKAPSGKDVCEWNGVYCRWLGGNVSTIELSPSKLQGGRGGGPASTPGFLPPEVGELFPGLQKLQLKGYPVLGTLDEAIPTQVTKLASSLQELIINDCGLSGTIPEFLRELTHLGTLDLSRNKRLTGPVPLHFLDFIPRLTRIRLAENQLEGSLSINPPQGIGRGRSLVELKLQKNQLTGTLPSQLGSHTVLSNLEVGWNHMTGTIPTQIGSLRRISTLELSHMDLSGTIPTQLGLLRSTQRLQLDANPRITGAIPSQLGELRAAFRVDLAFTNPTGGLPQQVEELKRKGKCSLCLENTTLEKFGTHCEHNNW